MCSSVGVMSAVLSRQANSVKYTPLGPLRLPRPVFRIFNSRRHSIIAAAVLLILFLLVASGISRGRIPDSHRWSSESLPGNLVDAVDWSRFAYTQYATNAPYLCNSVMLFERLHRLGSRAERLLMYPSRFEVSGNKTDGQSWESALLRKARDEYNVILKPIEVLQRDSQDGTWAESYTKLLAFNQTQYARVLQLDSDSIILQTMDELFFLPPVPLAIPRAYWLNHRDNILSSQLLLIQPSNFEFARISKAIDAAGSKEYDMEIVNKLYKDSALILPHRPYNMLTTEYRYKNHKDYMGNEEEPFDPERVLKECKFLHFSDWPMPKPWIKPSDNVREANMPECVQVPESASADCRAQKLWLGWYEDFARRRADVCNIAGSASHKRRRVKRAFDIDPTYEPYF